MWNKFKKNNLKNNLKLEKTILALAPMAGITDSAFRQICKNFGADIVYSEMASVTALVYHAEKTLQMLRSSKTEMPYIIQLFGNNPEHFREATRLLSDQKLINKTKFPSFEIPQGIDINFGCPVSKIAKQGAGAELMKDLKKSREIIKSVLKSTHLPVSIKIRAKSGEIDALKFLDNINDLDIKAVMIHGRTLSQKFTGAVDCEIIKKARNYFGGFILANGYDYQLKTDSQIADYYQYLLDKTQADGIGIARAVYGRPWIFAKIKNPSFADEQEIDKKYIKSIILKHAKLVYELKNRIGIIEMRKHLCWYVQGLPQARKIRQSLVQVENLEDIENLVL